MLKIIIVKYIDTQYNQPGGYKLLLHSDKTLIKYNVYCL